MSESTKSEDALLYLVADKRGHVFFKNFDNSVLEDALINLSPGKGIVEIEAIQRRYYRETGPEYIFAAVSNMDALRKSTRLFDENIVFFKAAAVAIADARKEILADVLHDLPGLHANTAQLFSLMVPEENLSRDFHEKLDDLKKLIENDLDGFARLVINTIRNNKIMNAEFKFIRLLNGEYIQTRIRMERLHPIIQSLLYLYYPLFDDVQVKIRNGICEDSAELDYETFVGGLIPILHNLKKYVKEGSYIDIHYSKDRDHLFIDISTMSLGVLKEEAEKIFERGYSGHFARELKRDGRGLGMYHAKSLLNMSHADIRFIPGDIKDDGYAQNVIKLILIAGK